MREILFRGQKKDSKDFVYGSLVLSKNRNPVICMVNSETIGINNFDSGFWTINSPAFVVKEGTVGQFTGLTDKNGIKIFEGDILKCEYFKLRVGDNLGLYETDEELIGRIYFDGLSLCVGEIKSKKWEEYTGYESGDGETRFIYLGDVYEGSIGLDYKIEVIGSIHDNPELLK